MAYKQSVYLKAKDRLDERRRAAEAAQQDRHSIALMRCPEIGDVEAEMASHGAEVIKFIALGGDAQESIRKLSEKNLAAQERRKILLKEKGFAEDFLDVHYTCPVCKDTGSHDGLYCKCYLDLIKQVAREDIEGIAPLKTSTFASFRADYYPDVEDGVAGISQQKHMESVLTFCKEYAKDFSKSSQSLFMYGKTGLGKTHLSLAIAGAAIDKGYNVFYGSIQTIMDALERDHFGKNEGPSMVKDDILSCDLLVIDDLGVEFSTQYTVSEVHNIINSRILKGLPTIISTNLDMKGIESRYSQRIASRILGSYVPIYFCGKDIRQRL